MSQFEPGVSGNPSGRPCGIKDRRTRFASMINPHKQQLFDKAIGMALDGNETMLKLFLSRILPAKPKDNVVSAVGLSGSIASKVDNVLLMIDKGELTPIEANEILSMLEKSAKLVNVAQIEQQVADLRQILKLRS